MVKLPYCKVWVYRSCNKRNNVFNVLWSKIYLDGHCSDFYWWALSDIALKCGFDGVTVIVYEVEILWLATL